MARRPRQNRPADRLFPRISEAGVEIHLSSHEVSAEEVELAWREHFEFEYTNEKERRNELRSIIVVGLSVFLRPENRDRLPNFLDRIAGQSDIGAWTLSYSYVYRSLLLKEQGQLEEALRQYEDQIARLEREGLSSEDLREWLRNGFFLVRNLGIEGEEPGKGSVPRFMTDFAVRLFERRWPEKKLPRRILSRLNHPDEALLDEIFIRGYRG